MLLEMDWEIWTQVAEGLAENYERPKYLDDIIL